MDTHGAPRLERRTLVKAGIFAAAASALPIRRAIAGDPDEDDRIPDSRLPRPFTVPFQRPPVARPVRRSATTDYYRITMREAHAEIIPGIRTPVFAYDGTVPGPTIQAQRGRRVIARFINQLPARHPTLRYVPWTSVHLHGARSLPQYDGYANDISFPGQYKDYVYENTEPSRSLWYHDHGFHHTAENVWSGLFASYHSHNPGEDHLRLPTGEFDVQLTVGDTMINKDGTLLFTLDDKDGMWGNIITVNGRPWPVMRVKRRKYKFRMLNAAASRSFQPYLSDSSPFAMVATDGGLMPYRQTVNSFRIGMAERYEFVLDFAKYRPGERIYMLNRSPSYNEDYDNTDKIMAFEVTDEDFDRSNNELPNILNPDSGFFDIDPSKAVRVREFKTHRQNGLWKVGEKTWQDVIDSNFNLTAAEPRFGDTEIWKFDNSGGWEHPMHIHLVDFRILSRDDEKPFAYEKGLKDVVYVGRGEEVSLAMRFDGGAGRYMFHCHNLVHEDHDMMQQFRVRGNGDIQEFSPFADPPRWLPEGPL